jgi:PD-(D/E)XK nuclease superfamily protein
MTETEQQPSWQVPEIPSKWDIIPIHNSDRAAFKRCRRYWDWTSPARNNLTVRADIHGINVNFFFGTGIHYALEQYYQPGLRRDPVEAFKTWFNIMWQGGTVTEDWLDKVYDLKPRKVVGMMSQDTLGRQVEWTPEQQLYVVRGLEDIIPSPDHEEWDQLFELGVGMMTYYKEYAERTDDFEVLVSEHNFSVPVWDFENNEILKMRDRREDSPNYGKLLEVHARGRIDGIYRKIATDKLGILEDKTATKWGEDELEKLEDDEQCTNYLWAAEIEADYYDLPHKGEPLGEVTYNVLRKAFPREPTELQSGAFSTNRQEEATTYDILERWIARNMPGVPLSLKQKEYVNYLREIGDENFIIRRPVRRNRYQLRNAGIRLYHEAMDMLSDPRIYPNITSDYNCRRCAFRAPCMAKEDGSDWLGLIKNNYTTNKDR